MMIKLSEKERKAVKEALEYIGYFDVAESPEMLQEWFDDGTIGIGTADSCGLLQSHTSRQSILIR